MINRRDLIISSALAGMAGVAGAQTKYKSEYRLSLVPGPGSTWYFAADRFAALVRENTGGRINMRLFPGSSLVQGAQDRELVALRQGVIDVIVGPTINYAGTVKDFVALHLPFLMPSQKAVDAVLASDALQKDFYGIVRRSGMEPLASAEYGYFQLVNSKRRVARPGDAEGLKIRTTATPMQQDIMNAFGANPTTMSWADAQPALSSGAIDGLTLTLEQMIAAKVPVLGQKYVTKWNAFNELIHFCVANPVWSTWTAADQAIVRDAARQAAQETTARVRQVQAAEQALKQQGVEIYTPSAAEMQEWQIAARRPYAKWKATGNPELISRLEEVVARALKG
ncbi:MAG: TRAP transporter substrate-binding protein DctP [Burkholderiaceae bacterium]